MKKFNPNKNIIITLILVIIIVAVLSITIARRSVEQKTSIVQSSVNDSVGFVDKVLYTPFRWIENGIYNVQNLFVTYEENIQLKSKLDNYELLEQQSKNNEREITALKEELDLSNTLTNYEKITANVITRSPDAWQDLLVVDKGAKDGIEPNMAVMSQKGLIGRVLEVNHRSSKVELLTTENQNSNHYPVRVSTKNGEAFGLLRGYDQNKNALIIEQLTGSLDINKDDVVQTSGLGGKSPSNLPVGTVIEAQSDSFGLDRKVYVQPYAQMYDISVVTVIKRSLGEE